MLGGPAEAGMEEESGAGVLGRAGELRGAGAAAGVGTAAGTAAGEISRSFSARIGASTSASVAAWVTRADSSAMAADVRCSATPESWAVASTRENSSISRSSASEGRPVARSRQMRR